MEVKNKEKILITGSAGFIGAALSKKFLINGYEVVGLDNLNDYYNTELKKARLNQISRKSKNSSSKWIFYNSSIEDNNKLEDIFKAEKPDIVVNLAAHAGVRYSLTNPSSFTNTNLVGFGNILENCRKSKIKHLVFASSSSVYGGNELLPYNENQPVNHPASLYAATKKANELMAHSYSHNFNLSSTGLRFFTVYGQWGRPDMAPIIFAKAISEGKYINVNNYGDMQRDFIYIDDIIEGVFKCCLKPATPDIFFKRINPNPSTSYAPHRIFNIGSSRAINLKYFIELIEINLKTKAKLNLCPLPKGDVIATNADSSALYSWIGFKPTTKIEDGIKKFIDWFKYYYSQ